jgi:outer membrane protein TolC
VQTIEDQMVALIQLYKALGGGWPPGETPADGRLAADANAKHPPEVIP